MAVTQLGMVQINNRPYRIEIGSFRTTDLVDFAPRGSSPGGSILYSELGLYQPLAITDWRHGIGFMWYTDAMGYMRTDGRVDTRFPGVVMLYTANDATTDTTVDTKSQAAAFNGAMWFGGTARLTKFNGSAYTAVGSITNINALLSTGSYLFVAPNGSRLQKVDGSDVVTNAGTATALDFKWMVIHNGYVYAGVDGTNRVHYDSSNDLATLQGDTADPTAIYVGGGGMQTLWAVSFNGSLYIARPDGLWRLDEQRIARRVLDFSDQISTSNFASYAIHNGNLVFPIRDRIFQWNGVRLADITPPQLSDAFPYVTLGLFDNFAVVGRFLYCTARDNQASYSEHLMCYDGTAWFRLAENLVTGGAGSVSMLAYNPVHNKLHYHVSNGGTQTTSAIQFQSLSEYPYSNFPTSGVHSVHTSRLDMGFRRVQKSTPSIIVEASNIAAGRSIAIYYSLDGAAYALWGTVTANGVTTLTAPGGSVQYNYIQFRIDLSTNNAAQTPVLEGLVARFIMRPSTQLGWGFDIPIAKMMDTGELVDTRNPVDYVDNLRADRQSAAPVAFVDPWGRTYSVYVSSLQERLTEFHDTTEGTDATPDLEGVVSVNLVQVG